MTAVPPATARPAPAAASSTRVVAASTALLTACVLPAFVAGSAAPQIREDFPLGEGALGLIFGGFWGALAVVSTPAGRLVERVGPLAGARLAAALSVGASLVIALTAQSLLALGLVLLVGGVAVAVVEPALNTLLARSVPPERQAFAFAVKQSGLPAGLVLTGLAVPVLAVPFGWRSLFVLAAVLAALAAAAVPAGPHDGAGGANGDRGPNATPRLERAPLLLLAAGAGFGTASIGALNAFLVVAGPDIDVPASLGALLLSVGSALTIAVRLLIGVRAGRRTGGHLNTVAAMLAAGSVGFVALTLGVRAASVAGALVVITFVWGWMGLLSFALVRYYPDAPGRATGFVQTGLFAGTLLGPVLFGQLTERVSFTVAWLVPGTWSLLAAALFVLAARAVRRTGRGGAVGR